MSQQKRQQPGEQGINSAIDGMDQMEARQMTIHEWTVISWRNDCNTAHTVDLYERTCTCEDYQFNNEGMEVCDHILLAGHYADRAMDVQAALDHEMRTQMLELERHVRAIERRAAGAQADVAHEQATADSGGSQASDDSWQGDPVEEFNSLLRDAGLDPDDFNVWVDEQYGSLQVDQDGYLDDDEFSTWVDFSDDLDMAYDGDEDNNFLKPDRFPEVFG